MRTLGINRFDQCVLNAALVHLCNQSSDVGQELQKLYRTWTAETDAPVINPWSNPYWFTIYIPHPDQQYENITLEETLTQGYNIEVQRIDDRSQIPYALPSGAHFVVVLRQPGQNAEFSITATGLFIRPLAVLSLDVVIDPEKSEYRPLLIKHPVIRDYPTTWEQQLKQFVKQEVRGEDLPQIVGYVDQAINQDYRPPSWKELYLAGSGFKGF